MERHQSSLGIVNLPGLQGLADGLRLHVSAWAGYLVQRAEVRMSTALAQVRTLGIMSIAKYFGE